jgi:hypothetical protein
VNLANGQTNKNLVPYGLWMEIHASIDRFIVWADVGGNLTAFNFPQSSNAGRRVKSAAVQLLFITRLFYLLSLFLYLLSVCLSLSLSLSLEPSVHVYGVHIVAGTLYRGSHHTRSVKNIKTRQS